MEKKPTGGKVELLIEKIIDPNHALAMIKTSKKIHSRASNTYFKINLFRSDRPLEEKLIPCYLIWILTLQGCLKTFGHVPLPPYIKRKDEEKDC